MAATNIVLPCMINCSLGAGANPKYSWLRILEEGLLTLDVIKVDFTIQIDKVEIWSSCIIVSIFTRGFHFHYQC